MNQDKYIKYIQQGKNPYKEEFNKVAKALDMILASDMSEELRTTALNNLADSMNGRPHKQIFTDDKSKLRLEF